MEMISNKGNHKIEVANQHALQFFLKSLMAGMLLGVALIFSYSIGYLFKDNYGLSKTLMAFTFGIGIVSILFLKAELFTGNCFTTMVTFFDKDIKVIQLLKTWMLCLLGNALGIILFASIFMIAQGSNEGFSNFVLDSAQHKVDVPLFSLLAKGALCNFIVCCASYIGYKVKDDSAKTIIIMLLIAAFYVAGLEHSVANFGTFTMALFASNFQGDVIAMLTQIGIVLIGNILGGSFLFGVPIYCMLSFDEQKH